MSTLSALIEAEDSPMEIQQEEENNAKEKENVSSRPISKDMGDTGVYLQDFIVSSR